MMTWATNDSAILVGSFLASPRHEAAADVLDDTFLTLKPTLSPGIASGRVSWCISMDLTSVDRPAART